MLYFFTIEDFFSELVLKQGFVTSISLWLTAYTQHLTFSNEIMKQIKDELLGISEKGETYSEVIQRVIEHYNSTKSQDK